MFERRGGRALVRDAVQRGEFDNQPQDLSLLDVGISQDMEVYI